MSQIFVLPASGYSVVSKPRVFKKKDLAVLLMNIWLLTYKIKLHSERFSGLELWSITFMQVFISISDHNSQKMVSFLLPRAVCMKSVFFKNNQWFRWFISIFKHNILVCTLPYYGCLSLTLQSSGITGETMTNKIGCEQKFNNSKVNYMFTRV